MSVYLVSPLRTPIGRYGGGLLKMSPDGAQVEAYYFNPNNLPHADLDWGSAPMLFTASDGTPLVAATGKFYSENPKLRCGLRRLENGDLSSITATSRMECRGTACRALP